jgi:signal transduction histidine kinase
MDSAPAPNALRVGARRPAVLIVDDEYGPRESIAFSLASEFDVETSERAQDAIVRLRERQFEVVLLDIRMPEMDGIRALEEIRKVDREIAVIMLTGYGTLATAQQALVWGANQYLRKPPDIYELLNAVRQSSQAAIERRQRLRMVAEAIELNDALKREIQEKEPKVWQARAAVELVHDLANPLTVLIGYAGLLSGEAKKIAGAGGSTAALLAEYAEVVERSAGYCQHLAENWRKATRQSTSFAPVDIVDLLREVKRVIFFSSDTIRISGPMAAAVLGAKFELSRVLQNLIRNSLEAGSKKIDVKVSLSTDSVSVKIQDDGCGMDDITREKAWQGDFTTKASGTGLGLSICRHLIGVHGGQLTLASTPGLGTTTCITLPRLNESNHSGVGR